MTFRSIHLRRPGPAQLDALLAEATTSELSYTHVGSTLDPESDRTITQHDLVLGSGQACFHRSIDRLRQWAPQREIGATVFPTAATLEAGVTLLVVLPAGPFCIVVPDRIVAVIDEPRCFGFAYGTLDGHHERGEESFIIELDDDDQVRGTICIDATEATVAARLARPVVSRFQGRAASGYLRGLAD